MAERRANPWYVPDVEDATVERLASTVEPHPRAVEMGVDIVGDPHREDDDGYNWTRLHYARNVADVTPGFRRGHGQPSRDLPGQGRCLGLRGQRGRPIVTLDLLP